MKNQLLLVMLGFSMVSGAAHKGVKPQTPIMQKRHASGQTEAQRKLDGVSECVRLTSDFGITIARMAYKDIAHCADKTCVQACCYLFGNMIDRRLQPYIGQRDSKKNN
jgi:hypothetical protein